MTQKTEKILSVQMLRGVAAFLVTSVHVACGSPQYLEKATWLRDTIDYGVYGVQMFFVISGFVLPYALYHNRYRIGKFGNFLWRRVLRIDPPYLISIAIALILAWVSTLSPFYRGKPLSINWADIGLHIGYLNGLFHRPWAIPVYWTLAIEFQFYILLGLLFTVFQKSNDLVRGIILVSFLVLSLVVHDRVYIFCHAPIFLMGVFTFFYFEKLISKKALIAATIVLTIVGGFSFNWYGIWFGLITVPAILLWNRVSKFWLFLGTISYSLYLLHVPIGSRISNLTEALTSSIYIRLMIIPVSFIVCITAAYIYYRVVEVRAVVWSKKIKTQE